jgi:anti-sigma B factor antagonist
MIQLTEETRSGWHVIGVRGRADAETADTLEGALKTALEQHLKVAADLSGVEYISSAGLRAVVQAARVAQTRNAEFAVCALSAPVQKVFDISGLHHIVKIHGELPC